MRLRADWVLPITGPPIRHGEVVVEDGRIADVRPSSGPVSDARDLGNAVLMPGLVNVHTHLDYTLMRGLLEDIEFFPWIRALTVRKAALDEDDWRASATCGAAEAAAGGVTTIGDCTDSGAALDGARLLGLRGIIYQEVFGIDTSRSVAAIVDELDGKLALLRDRTGDRLRVGVSPHAPYTVRPELFAALRDYAATNDLPLCIHAAESRAEAELLRAGTGPIAEMLARRHIQWTPPRRTTVAYLAELGLLTPQTLLVHGVQVSVADQRIVKKTGASWAHCPKSNAKLGVGVAPLRLLGRKTGRIRPKRVFPRLGIGSDSVASGNTMDLFEEMRFAVLIQRAARRRIDALTAVEALEMATIGGAAALGMAGEVGSLQAGKRADLTAVSMESLHSAPSYDPYSALVYTARASDVVLTVVGGEVVYESIPGSLQYDRFPAIDLRPARRRLESAAEKMRAWRPPP